MKRYSQSFTRVVHLLLVVALLLTFAAPAFAEGGPLPNKKTADVVDGEELLESFPSLSSQEIEKAMALQQYLFIDESGRLELKGDVSASDLGISNEEYAVVLQFLADFNDGTSVIGFETASQEIVRVGTEEFARLTTAQIDYDNISQGKGVPSPDWYRHIYWRRGIYVHLNSGETWWVVHGYSWTLAGIFGFVAAVVGTPLGWGAAGAAAAAVVDITNRYAPRTMDLWIPWKGIAFHYYFVRFHGSRARWLNNRWIYMRW